MEANSFADSRHGSNDIGQSPRQNVFLSYKIFIHDNSWSFVIIRVKKIRNHPVRMANFKHQISKSRSAWLFIEHEVRFFSATQWRTFY